MIKVLVVEDEREIAAQVAKYITREGYKPIVLNSGEHVIDTVKQELPDIIVLDVMLPIKDGVTCCKEIREFSEIPIIMLTARKTENDRILGLQAGVDDYVCKPFSAKELMLRIQAILKRTGIENKQENSGLQLDKNGFFLKYNGQETKLTNLEFSLLNLLMQKPGRIYSREQIIELAYNNECNASDRAIDSHIKNIRKKVRSLAIEHNVIETTYGAGFRYVPIS
ncbi:response regulator [Colwellia psychrerythraea]|uniref:Two component transcriptional regulator, winged helix family n=1 Tax=Colwellia psychrerythraea TaxID=28229 RepID=A0A099L3K4_COLPS|nr:response regulator [Colwellia psychrerythraea]KGJ97446.1 two component transcriptional regulator, winged helix family [Colwellia psychrerythraea]